MTQQPTQHRKSSGQFTWLWMLATFVVIGGFMYWLGVTAEPSTARVVEEEEAEADVAATTVTVDDVVADLSSHLGKTVRLEGITVASRLGTQAFWTASTRGQPLLVRLAPSLAASANSLMGGEKVTVVGRVVAMSDSVLAAWEIEGVITGEAQRMEAEFATAFVQAATLEALADDAQE